MRYYAAVVLTLGLSFSSAQATPVPIPPVAAPPVRVPPVPSQLSAVGGIVGPSLLYDCAAYASLSAVAGLGLPAVANLVPAVAFPYAPSYLALAAIGCGVAPPLVIYDCALDQRLFGPVQSLPAPVALPIPAVAAIAGETLFGAASAAGNAALVNGEVSALGCAALGSQLGPVPPPARVVAAPTQPSSSGALLPPTPAGPAARTLPASEPVVTSTASMSTPASSPASAPISTFAAPAAVTHPPSTKGRAVLAVLLLLAAVVVAGAMWAGAGHMAARE